MKTLRFLCLFFLGSLAHATEYFSGSGSGSERDTSPRERDYTTPWLNTLIAQIQASPNLTSVDRANTIQLVADLSVIAAQPGTFGNFARSVGGSSGTIIILRNPDYLVGEWHVPGTGYLVDMWLEAPSAPPTNRAPGIAWVSPPANAAHGEAYTLTARGHDDDGNLTQVNVWKNGQPFAFAGGGSGFDGNSGNTTSDGGPQTVTFTAQAVDGDGASSPTISWTVTINAPPPVNRAPTISWKTVPGTVAHSEGYTISARGQDEDGNLTQVNVWKNGQPFAFADGGSGFDGNSGNTTSDGGPQNVTFTAQAVDGAGASSPTISWTVTIHAPPPLNRAPTISWTAAPGTVAHGETYTVSAHGRDEDGNLTQVNVWRNGSPYAFAGGGNGVDGDSSNASTDGGPQTIIYTAQAVDSNGATSATISQTVTVGAPPPVNQAPTVSWTIAPGTVASGENYTVSAHGHDPDGNLTQINVWKNGQPFAFAGGGTGTDGDSGNATSDVGPAVITFTAQAVDANGATSAILSQSVTVSAPPPVNRAPAISWNSVPGTVSSGQSYLVSAHGYDPDGNLTQVNVWRNGQPFAFAGGGNGTDGDSGNPATDTGPLVVTYTAQAVDSSGATSPVISQTVTVNAPPPVNRAPTIAWTAAPGSVASGQSYTVSAHGNDPDGNLSQIRIWKDGQPFAAAAASGTDGNAGGAGLDTGPKTIVFTAQAFDSAGAGSPIVSQTLTVNAPPPVQFTLTTTAGAGGTVSPGGTYNSRTVVAISASADAIHDFAGWSGDAAGLADPVSVTLDRNKTVQANFSLKRFALTTSTAGGGSVTAGGSYPYGAVVTLSAAPDAVSRFVGWAGDATGGALSVAITMTAARSVQALFMGKTAQTISFPILPDYSLDSAPFLPGATATSGLPVDYVVLSGPATMSGGLVQLTGSGAVTILASQPGDATYLSASAVVRTFNAVAPVVLKYRPTTRTRLQREGADGPTSLVLEKP